MENDLDFTKTMTDVEASTWCFFISIVNNFLSDYKAENYVELVQN